MAAKGDALSFRGMCGDVWEATAAAAERLVNGKLRIAIDINPPGCREPVRLAMVLWREVPTEEPFTAWPRQDGDGRSS